MSYNGLTFLLQIQYNYIHASRKQENSTVLSSECSLV